jgi:hypothetical protein
LRGDLAAMPWLLDDLEITITRQDKLSDPTGRSGDERPLPIRINAMEARRDLNATLAGWAMHIAGRLDGLTGSGWNEPRLANYLLDHLGTILTDPAAGQIADEIGYAKGMAMRAIDKPAPRVYVGPKTATRICTHTHGQPRSSAAPRTAARSTPSRRGGGGCWEKPKTSFGRRRSCLERCRSCCNAP